MKISRQELINGLLECKKGDHKLAVINRYDVGYGAEHVARWCKVCGSVVVDIDVDNRIRHRPGGAMKMSSPTITRAINGKSVAIEKLFKEN